MKTNTKRLLVLGLLGLFVLVFAMQFVAAEVPISNMIKSWFGGWAEGEDFSPYIAKYLFWALVSMVVFSISSSIPGLEGLFGKGREWLGAIFSIIIGFLAMAYITPEEVYVMMSGYSALGFVIGGFLPFIILIVFTFKLGTDTKGGPYEKLSKKAIAWIMWAAFIGFIIYKLIVGYGNTGSAEMASAGIRTLHWILLAISIIILISMGAVFKKLGGMITQEKFDKYAEMNATQVNKLKTDVEALEDAVTAP